ncbi:MAG: YitT family protein [Ruminococcaceae bacterium]|nr:YitT family protein [Oscillospiraceae bacterium]
MKKLNKESVKTYLYDLFYLVAGSFFFAISVNMFLAQAENGGVILGGATGIAMIISHFIELFPIGTLIIFINIPLIIAGFLMLGKGFIIRTAIGMLMSSIFTNIFTFFPITVTDPLLCSIFGGLTMGVALGLIYMRGYTTGGGDILVMILKKLKPRLSTGHATLIVDATIVVTAAILFKDPMVIFYSVIVIFVESKTMDFVLVGANNAKNVYVISDKSDEIAKGIAEHIERGITIIDCKGWYTGKEKKMIMCVIRPAEVYDLRHVVSQTDPDAFIIFCEASKVVGKGFIEGKE